MKYFDEFVVVETGGSALAVLLVIQLIVLDKVVKLAHQVRLDLALIRLLLHE